MMSKALVAIKRVYQFESGHAAPVNNVRRYPILLSSLMKRIAALAKEYNLTFEIKVFDLAKGKALAQEALRGLGGIYILHCKTTGLFYVGSAWLFFGLYSSRLTPTMNN